MPCWLAFLACGCLWFRASWRPCCRSSCLCSLVWLLGLPAFPFPFRFVLSLGCGLFCFPSLASLLACLLARLPACPSSCRAFVCVPSGWVSQAPGSCSSVLLFACSASLLVGWVAVLLGVCCVRSRFFVPPVPLLAGAGPPHCSSPVRAQRTNARAHATGVLVFDRRDEQHLPSLIAPAGLPMCGK